jgi:hypothetical protein
MILNLYCRFLAYVNKCKYILLEKYTMNTTITGLIFAIITIGITSHTALALTNSTSYQGWGNPETNDVYYD